MAADDEEATIRALRDENTRLKEELAALRASTGTQARELEDGSPNRHHTEKKSKLSREDIHRYSRHLLLPEISVDGQLQIVNSSVLVVGAGGLGSPACLYLASAGIGRLGIVDYDAVEVSNLQRQIIHDEERVGMSKARSAAQTVRRLNSLVDCVVHELLIDSTNALELVKQYDIILDCSDNPPTRYLINDACVLTGKPLVSGSALRFEGQLTVYHHRGSPCYRCVFSVPPPPAAVTNCGDGGVFGPVPGLLGTLQALEALKIAAGLDSSYSGKLLMLDALAGTFRTIKLRGRRKDCAVCGDHATVTALQDYPTWCGMSADDKGQSLKLLSTEDRITPQQYSVIRSSGVPHLLVDTRPAVQTRICALDSALNVPFDEIEMRLTDIGKAAGAAGEHLPVYCICRRGNDSQLAVLLLKEKLPHLRILKDVVGGFEGWRRDVDPQWPEY